MYYLFVQSNTVIDKTRKIKMTIIKVWNGRYWETLSCGWIGNFAIGPYFIFHQEKNVSNMPLPSQITNMNSFIFP